MHRWDPINPLQLRLLTRIADGEVINFVAERATVTLRAIRDRGLVSASAHRGVWQATITDAGWFYVERGYHPDRPARSNARRENSSDADGYEPKPRGKSGHPPAQDPRPEATQKELDALYKGLDVPKLSFTLQQAADASSLSTATLTAAIHGRRDDVPRLPAKKMGDRYLITALDLLRWIHRLPDA